MLTNIGRDRLETRSFRRGTFVGKVISFSLSQQLIATAQDEVQTCETGCGTWCTFRVHLSAYPQDYSNDTCQGSLEMRHALDTAVSH